MLYLAIASYALGFMLVFFLSAKYGMDSDNVVVAATLWPGTIVLVGLLLAMDLLGRLAIRLGATETDHEGW